MSQQLMSGFFAVELTERWSAPLLVCLVTVAVLVGLFGYLDQYTRRRYFRIWSAAWLFYGLWLALNLTPAESGAASLAPIVRRLAIATSAVFLYWGTMCFLKQETPQRLMGMFLGFICVWSISAPFIIEERFLVELPCFGLIGIASMGAGAGMVARREHRRFAGARLLSVGFALWGVLLAAHPITGFASNRIDGAFYGMAAVQLFIAVGMIVLVLEETRAASDAIIAKIRVADGERKRLVAEIQEAETRARSLFADASLKAELEMAYESLRLAHRGVVEQERLSVLGQVASGMAHDINNALTPVIGFSEVLLASGDEIPPQVKVPLRHIRDAGRKIETIVGRVRQFYRPRDADALFVQVNLSHLLGDILARFGAELETMSNGKGQGRCVIAAAMPQDISIEADPVELEEVFVQVLKNAREAMPGGGRISVAVRVSEATTAGTDPSRSGQVIVEISDEGTGMDDALRLRCIEPFYTTKKPRQSGLGLAVAYGSMRRHAGSLQIESEPGRGTTVRLVFPPPASLRKSSPPPSLGRKGGSMRILCVDDEPVVLNLLADVLQMHGHQVETRPSGLEAIGAFQSAHARQRPFDLVVTDLGMPDVDGRQVIRSVKVISPGTPVIVVTGWADLIEPGDLLLEQAEGILKKPLSLCQLQKVLERIGTADGSAIPSAQIEVSETTQSTARVIAPVRPCAKARCREVVQ